MIKSFQAFALQSIGIINWGDDVFSSFEDSLVHNQFILQENDVVVITSKVITMQQKAAILLSEIIPSEKAIKLGEEAKLDPRVAELVLQESNNQVYGCVFHSILAKTEYGLSANAGIDLSNAPDGFALLLPRNPDKEAEKIRQKIFDKYKVKVAVLIIDSRTIPLKRGTTAVALGVSGMDPIVDERGKKDLYGYTMTITTRAIADNLASAANMIMGETNERTPFGVIRGFEYTIAENVSMKSTLMPEDQCIYFGPFMKTYTRD